MEEPDRPAKQPRPPPKGTPPQITEPPAEINAGGSGLSEADAALVEAGRAKGHAVSPAQLERWRGARLLPQNCRVSLGRGRGSTSTPPPQAEALVVALAERAAPGVPAEELTLRLYFERPDLPIDDVALRAALAWYVTKRDRSAFRRARDAMSAASAMGASADAIEDAAAAVVHAHYRNLDSWTRRGLKAVVPRIEDMMFMAAAGVEALGEDAALSIPVASDDDGVGVALRQALLEHARNGDGKSITTTPTPDEQATILVGLSRVQIDSARSLLTDVAEFVRLVQFLQIVAPHDEQSGRWADVFGSMAFLTMMASIFTPDGVGEPLPWRLGTKLLAALLTTEGFASQWLGLHRVFTREAPALVTVLRSWLETQRE